MDKTTGFAAGDIGFSTSNAWLSKAIRFFTSWHTSSASRSHTFTFISKDQVVEALGKVRCNPAAKYADQDVAIYRIPLDDTDRAAFHCGMINQVNRAYGWLKIPLFAFDAIVTKVSSVFGNKKPVFFFTKFFGVTNIPVCSQLVIWGLHKFTKYRVRNENGKVVPWRIVSPDYFEDLLQLPVNGASMIYPVEEDNCDV